MDERIRNLMIERGHTDLLMGVEDADLEPRLIGALNSLSREGDRVATLSLNHYQHLETYFAIPCMGAVVHPLNIRFSPEDLAYIINHAEDRVIIVDHSLLHLIEAVRPKINIEKFFVVQNTGAQLSSDMESYDSLLEHVEAALPLEQVPDPGPEDAERIGDEDSRPLHDRLRAGDFVCAGCAYWP